MRHYRKSICTSRFITTAQCSQQQRLALCGVHNDPSYHPHDPPLLPTGQSRTTLVLAAFNDKPAKAVVIAAIVSMPATSSVDSLSSDGFVEERLIAARKRFLSSKIVLTDAVGTFFVATGPSADKHRLALS